MTTRNFLFQVEVREFPNNLEETDTRVVLYLHHAATIGYKNAEVRTPGTDIVVILPHPHHQANYMLRYEVSKPATTSQPL